MRHVFYAFLAGLVFVGAQTSHAEAGRSFTMVTKPLVVEDSNRAVGELRLLAAFELSSFDPAFGGFSGVAVRRDGHSLTAVSDRGHWMTAALEHDADGVLLGVESGRLGALLRPDGEPVRGPEERDAEELVRLGGGAWWVSFEGTHRIWRYPSSREPSGLPAVVATPDALTRAGGNVGLEAMARLVDGRIVILTEDFRRDDGSFIGWIGNPGGGRWRPLAVRPTEDFKPTGAAPLANGDLLLLQRAYDPRTGVRCRLSTIAKADLEAGEPIGDRELGRLDPSHHVDNLEAVAVWDLEDGSQRIYLLSDDNFSQRQRTVLLQLAW